VDTVRDLLGGLGRRRLVTIDENSKITDAMSLMKKYDIEQIPVMMDGKMSGCITQASLFKKLIEEADVRDQLVADVMDAPLPIVDLDTPWNASPTILTRNGQYSHRMKAGSITY